MVGALIILTVLLGLLLWVVIRTIRVPRKPEHEREPEHLRDPMLTSHKGPQGGI